MKIKEDKLDVDKFIPVSFNLSKLSGVGKNDVVKKDVYNAKMKHIVIYLMLVTYSKKLTITNN